LLNADVKFQFLRPLTAGSGPKPDKSLPDLLWKFISLILPLVGYADRTWLWHKSLEILVISIAVVAPLISHFPRPVVGPVASATAVVWVGESEHPAALPSAARFSELS
jgi:hypothetical protein